MRTIVLMVDLLLLLGIVLGGAVNGKSSNSIGIGDNVAFLTFNSNGETRLNNGSVVNISEDGDWILINTMPNNLTVVSKWFVYSDETITRRLLNDTIRR